MEGGDYAGGYEVHPDPRTGFLVWVGWKESLGGGVGIFEKLADNGAFVEGLVVVFKCWDEASGIEFQEGFGLVVGVYLALSMRLELCTGRRLVH